MYRSRRMYVMVKRLEKSKLFQDNGSQATHLRAITTCRTEGLQLPAALTRIRATWE